jgi:hypothetical protein
VVSNKRSLRNFVRSTLGKHSLDSMTALNSLGSYHLLATRSENEEFQLTVTTFTKAEA